MKDLKMKGRTINLIAVNTEQYLYVLGVGKDFLNQTPTALTEGKMDKFNYILKVRTVQQKNIKVKRQALG